jgi:hypothetical protein
MDTASIAALPGVLQAAVADDAGRLLAHAGGASPPSTPMLVLAHATLSAAAELGRRAGAGTFFDMVQHHAAGCIYLRVLTPQQALMVCCENEEAVAAVRHALETVPSPDSARPDSLPPPPPTAAFDLAAALHAEPAW